VIVAASRGLPLLIVARCSNTITRPCVCTPTTRSTPSSTRRPDDHGRATLVWIQLLQKKYGIHFNLQPMSYGLAGFLANPAASRSACDQRAVHRATARVRVKTLPIADSGYDAYHVIFCRRDFALANPEVTRAFVAASVRGWRDYIEGDPTPPTGSSSPATPR